MKNLLENRMKKNGGFSLIEVLFSMAMFMMGIFAVASLMNGEIVKSINRRNESIAGQLAQEGIELVRNIRDNNWLSGKADSFDGIDDKDNGIIDYNNHKDKVGNGSNSLYLDNGFYSHDSSSSSQESIFSRKIIVKKDPDDTNKKIITSVVVWGGVGFPNNNNLPSECNAPAKCFYTEVDLDGTWGKNSL